jgi:hypothetical protein
MPIGHWEQTGSPLGSCSQSTEQHKAGDFVPSAGGSDLSRVLLHANCEQLDVDIAQQEGALAWSSLEI